MFHIRREVGAELKLSVEGLLPLYGVNVGYAGSSTQAMGLVRKSEVGDI